MKHCYVTSSDRQYRKIKVSLDNFFKKKYRTETVLQEKRNKVVKA